MTKITITITERSPNLVEIDVTPERSSNVTTHELKNHLLFLAMADRLTEVIASSADTSVILDDVSQFTPEQIDAIRKRV